MKEFELVKALYRPVQPTISTSQQEVLYQELKPSPLLQDFIYCYWQIQTQKPLAEPFTYRVVADGCIDIFFNLNDSTESFVMGFCKNYTEFPIENAFNFVGIRFFPSAFPHLFGINAKELANTYLELDTVVATVAHYIEQQFHPNLSLEQIGEKLNQFLLELITHKTFDLDSRFYNALNLILKSFGTLKTEQELDIGVSTRQLRRVFNYYIGTTPKTFSKVVRFQHILNAKPSTQSLKKSKVFYDTGFYDQAHFIKDFKNFYGVTPTKAFR